MKKLSSLYFWGDHLYRQKRYSEARSALQKALQAAPTARPGNPRCGATQRDRTLLVDVNKKLD